MVTSVPRALDFQPYAQLIGALLPRAAGVTVFDPDVEVQWTNEPSVSPALVEQVNHSLQTTLGNDAAGTRLQLHGEPVYVFWMREPDAPITAILTVSWRHGDVEQRTFAYVHSMLKPVLECLRREIQLRKALAETTPAAVVLTDDDGDLQVLLATSGGERRDIGDDEIAHLLANTTHHMQCEFSALVVPERGLVAVNKAEGRNVDTSGLAKLHRHLLSLAQVQTEPALLNDAAALPGLSLFYRVLSAPIRNPAGRACGVLALFRKREAPEFRRRDAQLSQLLARRAATIIDASYDNLSGVLTREAFEQRARVKMLERRPAPETPWTALYIDTDRMHVINDNYGMHVGDRLLARLGVLIRARSMPGSLAARISGDRFAILLPTAAEDGMRFAEALRQGVEGMSAAQLGAYTDTSFAASVSIGAVEINDPRTELAQALSLAEIACKAAKDHGRNRAELYQASDASIMRRYDDINIAPALRAAITESRLRLESQLIAPLPGSSGTKPHFELLLRMIDEKGQSIGPDRFMSAAVRYQLMPAVDRWVVQAAIRALSPHAEALSGCPVVFSINLSGQSLYDEEFTDFVIEQIRDSNINPQVFCFEITESAAIANLARAEVMMRRLRDIGCSIALDDFGTGLSSLAYLQALPVDILKIDGCFVRDVLKDPRSESMVKAIAQLARSMKLATVAEYVETDEIRLRIDKLGVDYGQGFAIARPVPIADTIRDLPMYALAAERRPGDELVLGANDDTITADLQKQLFGGMPVSDLDDTQSRINKLLEGYDHSESALYQRKAQ